MQKAFCLNTSHFLIKRSISADFIDSRLLEESQVEQGRLINALGAYRILVIPYALALPRKAFEMCLEFAKAGGKLVFVGTPVAFDEFGNSLSSDFAKLLQMPEMSAEHYVRGIACTLPESGRPARLEACRPLASDLPHKLVSIEGEIHGVKAGNVVFLTDLDPQQRLIDQIADVRDLTVRAHGDNLLWRLYRDESGDSLVIVSADDRPVGGVVFWGELVLEILGGFSGVFTLDASGAPIQEGDIAWKVLMR